MPDPLLYVQAMVSAASVSVLCVLAMVATRKTAGETWLNSACVPGIGLGLAVGYYVLLLHPAWPPANSSYEECEIGKIIINDEFGNTNCIDYVIFDNNSVHSNEIDVSIDVSEWLESNDVHTLYVVLNNENNERVDSTSITLEYLE